MNTGFVFPHGSGQRTRVRAGAADVTACLTLGFASAFSSELGKVEVTVFDPDSLDPNRCESCYGAESEDIK